MRKNSGRRSSGNQGRGSEANNEKFGEREYGNIRNMREVVEEVKRNEERRSR